MNTTAIGVIHDHMEVGFKLEHVAGKIVWIGDLKSGTVGAGPRKGKPWKLQNFMLAVDGGDRKNDKDSIGCTLNGCDEMPTDYLNSLVTITATNGNHGLNGIVVDFYNNKKTLKLSGQAKIEKVDGSSSQPNSQPAAAAATDTKPNNPPPPQDPKPPSDSPKTPEQEEIAKKQLILLRKIKQFLGKSVAVHNLTIDAAVKLGFDIHERHGVAVTPSQIFKWAGSMKMDLVNQGFGSVFLNIEMPWNNYNVSEFIGKPLSELIPFLKESIFDHREQVAKIEKKVNEQPSDLPSNDGVPASEPEASSEPSEVDTTTHGEESNSEPPKKEEKFRAQPTEDGSAFPPAKPDDIEEDVPF